MGRCFARPAVELPELGRTHSSPAVFRSLGSTVSSSALIVPRTCGHQRTLTRAVRRVRGQSLLVGLYRSIRDPPAPLRCLGIGDERASISQPISAHFCGPYKSPMVLFLVVGPQAAPFGLWVPAPLDIVLARARARGPIRLALPSVASEGRSPENQRPHIF